LMPRLLPHVGGTGFSCSPWTMLLPSSLFFPTTFLRFLGNQNLQLKKRIFCVSTCLYSFLRLTTKIFAKLCKCRIARKRYYCLLIGRGIVNRLPIIFIKVWGYVRRTISRQLNGQICRRPRLPSKWDTPVLLNKGALACILAMGLRCEL
jgi:hypothetical protein